MKKVSTHILMGLTCFSVMPGLLFSLPTNPEVVSGSASITVTDQSAMVIEVENGSILQYQNFNIGAEEMVRFVQPSSSSTVLNRVVGNEGSEILGKMESNGKVFLVNPNGVFFGKEAQVDMGSLITSTLDIADTDFLNGNFEFNLQTGSEDASIFNTGTLKAKGDGSIVLLSANVRNEGTIVAKTGKVVLASGEKVLLDFIGDGLMQFSVEGSLEKSMIEQAGNIEAVQGYVHLKVGHVKQVIQNVINAEGIEVASEILEENGVIRLVDTSSIVASGVNISGQEGSQILVQGLVDVSSVEGVGGSIYVFGQSVSVSSATVNASGAIGGGEILIGGDAFGQGSYFTSQNTNIHPGSMLTADALSLGNGGKIVVWSNDVTQFDGIATAKGGTLGGHGGFVETSGKMGLRLAVGSVSTSAPLGAVGTWLLDPFAIVINSSGVDSLSNAQNASDLTSTSIVNASIFESATSNIVLSAMADGGSITVAEDTTVVMAPGYGLTFSVDLDSGNIFLANNSEVITQGGFVNFNGKVTVSGDNASVRTNASDSSGSIYFASTLDGSSGSSNLTLETGVLGDVRFENPVGANSALGQLTIDTGTLHLGTNIFTKGESVSIRGATLLTADSIIDTTLGGSYAGGAISFSGEESTIDGPYAFLAESGSGFMSFEGNVGDFKTLRSFKAKGGQTTLSGNSFVTDGNTQIWETAVVVNSDMTFTDNGTSGVYFLSTLNSGTGGAVNVTVSAPIGTAYFVGAVGGINPLASLTVSASEIVQVSTATVNNSAGSASSLTYSGPLGISVGGDITAGTASVSPGSLTFNNPVLFTANVGSVSTAGTLALVVNSGTSTASSVTINGVSVGSGNLRINGDTRTVVRLQNSAVNLVSLNVDADSITQDANSAIFATGSITLDASAGASAKTLSTAASISTTTGSINLLGGASVDTVASDLNAGTGNIVLTPLTIAMSYQGVIQTTGGSVTANASGGASDLALTGTTKVDVGDGSVTFNKIDGAQNLSVSGGGVASLTLSGALGGGTSLAGLIVDIGSILQSSTVSVTGDVTYVAPIGITLANNITGGSSGNVTIVGPTIMTGPVTITTGNNISFADSTSTIVSPTTARALTLVPGTSAIVTLGGAIGTGNPLASLSITRGSQVNVASNITVTGAGAIAFTPAVVLTGDSTMTSTSGAITFSSTLNGTQILNLNTAGAVTFGGIVGGVNYLGGLNVVGGSIAVNTTAVNTVGGEAIFNGPVSLGSSATFTNNGEGVAFLGNITGTGTSALTVNAPIGLVRFGGTINGTISSVTVTALSIEQLGAVTPSINGNVTFSGSDSILVGANITATGTGAIAMNNPITLGTTITLQTASGNISLAGVTTGSDGLTLTSTAGSISLAAAPYSLSSLTATSTSGSITQASVSPITTIGNLNLTSTSSTVTTAASLISEGGSITLSSGTTLDVNSSIATNGGAVTLTGTSGILYRGGTIYTGNGNLVVANNLTLASADTAVDVGSGTALFSGIIDGAFNFSVNGSAIGTLTMTGIVGGVAPLTSVLAEIGHINQLSSLNTTGAVSYNAAVSIGLGGGITTTGAAGTITLMGPTTLNATTALATTNRAISFIGSETSIDGANALTFSSGTANIRIDGTIGLNTALASLSTTSTGNTLIGSSVTTTGAQTYGASASSGNILLTGPVVVGTTNSAVTFNGTINGAQSLFVNAGTGTVIYRAAVGAITPLTTLDTIGGSIIVNAAIKTR